ncbi:MAG: aromatic amino acid transport family protein [Dehalococcoidales bacterium]|jgi:tyrosine-specific transport protein
MEKDNSVSFFDRMMVALLVVGGIIGAGILALPVNTGLAGFIPSSLNLLLFGLGMFFTASVLAKEAVLERTDNFNYPSMYRKYLGVTGKWVAVTANLLLLYGLLVAYITGGSTIISKLFSIPAEYHRWVTIGFFTVLVGIIASNLKIVVKINAVFTVLMFTTFIAIVSMGIPHVKAQNLTYTDLQFLPCTIPIIVTAFNFHNVIPTVCKSLKWDIKLILRTILIGMAAGYAMYVIWMFIGVGAVPVEGGEASLIYAFDHNLPATIPLSGMINNPVFLVIAMAFSLVALTASCIANSTGLLAFVEDLMENTFRVRGRLFAVIIAFIPPLILSLKFPDLFLTALNIAGGFGIILLFGILPSVIAVSKSKGWRREVAFLIMLVFIAAFVFEVFQETGMLRIKPEVEYYKGN